VVRVSWDKAAGAGEYRVSGPTSLVGSNGRIEVPAHGDDPQALTRGVTWQTKGGETFNGFSVQAHMNSGWSNKSKPPKKQEPIVCSDFNPHHPGITRPLPAGVAPSPRPEPWPNLKLVVGDPTKRTSCTVVGKNRQCTAHWSEHITLKADVKWHGADFPHVPLAHPHPHSDGSGTHEILHHHCTTEVQTQVRTHSGHEQWSCPPGPAHEHHPEFKSADRSLWEEVVIVSAVGVGVAVLTLAAPPLVIGVTAGVAGVGTTLGLHFTSSGKYKMDMTGANGCLPSIGWHPKTHPLPDAPRVTTTSRSGDHATTTTHTIHYCTQSSESGG
jgi:hypothetical protein